MVVLGKGTLRNSMVVFFVDDLYLVHELFQLFGSIHRAFVAVREPSSPVALPISFNAFPICKGRIAMLLNAAMLISLAATYHVVSCRRSHSINFSTVMSLH